MSTPRWLKQPKADTAVPVVVRSHRPTRLETWPGALVNILERIEDTPQDAAIMAQWLAHWRTLGIPHVVVQHQGARSGRPATYYRVWKPCEEVGELDDLWVDLAEARTRKPWAPPPFAAGVTG